MNLERKDLQGVPVYELRLSSMDQLDILTGLQREFRESHAISGVAVLDLSRVDFLQSTSLGALVALSRQFTSAGGCLVLAGVGPRLVETFRIVRLDQLIAFRVLVEDAVEAAQNYRKQGSMKELVAANPAPAMARPLWAKRRAANGPDGEQPTSALAAAAARSRETDTSQPSSAAETVIEEDAIPEERMADWTEALLVFSRAEALYRRHGLAFSPTVSFREFLDTLSSRLSK